MSAAKPDAAAVDDGAGQHAIAPAGGAPGADESVATLDRVRDILFGQQRRDLESRLARGEERVLKELGALRDDVSRRFAALERFVEKEVGALADRLAEETRERGRALDGLQADLRQLVKALDERVGRLDEQTSRAASDLRRELLEQSTALREEIDRGSKDAEGELGRIATELEQRKVDRNDLAGLLNEVALRLGSEP